MGCGSSTVSARRSPNRYHGVAPVDVPQDTVTLIDSTPRRRSGSGSGSGVGESAALLAGEDALNRVLVSQAHKGPHPWVLAPIESMGPRHDKLMSFGDFKLQMVDELAHDLGSSDVSTMGVSTTSIMSACATMRSATSVDTRHLTARSAASSNQVSLTSTPALAHVVSLYESLSAYPFSARLPQRVQRHRLRACGGRPRRIKFVVFSPAEDVIFSCDIHSTVVTAYHVHLRCEIGRLAGHSAPVVDAAISADGLLVATVSWDSTLIVWEANTCKMRRSFIHPVVPVHCQFSPDGREVVTGCLDGVCHVWDIFGDGEALHAPGHQGSVMALAYFPDGGRILSGGADKRVVIWSPSASPACSSTQETETFGGHTSAVIHLEVQQRGTEHIVVSADERIVLVWSPSTQTIYKYFDSARIPVCAETAPCGSIHVSRRHAFWTAVRFGPGPFKDYVILAASTRTVFVCSCNMEEYGDAEPNAACKEAGGVTEDDVPLLYSSRGRFSFAHSPSGAAADGRSIALPLVLSSTVRTLSVGARTGVALGDDCGNTYQLELL